MDDLEHLVDDSNEQLRLFKDVFRATWQEALGRQWPNLAGDVEALCEQARRLGVAQAGVRAARRPGAASTAGDGGLRDDGPPRAGLRDVLPRPRARGRKVAERRGAFGDRE